MQGVGFAPSADVLTKLIEGVIDAVVRADDGNLAAPHEQRHRRFQKLVELLVESSLVDDDVALFAAQVGGARRQGGDAVARRAADDKGEDVFVAVVEDFFADRLGDQLVMANPVGAVADKFFGHILVVADIPDVHAGGSRRHQCRLGGG